MRPKRRGDCSGGPQAATGCPCSARNSRLPRAAGPGILILEGFRMVKWAIQGLGFRGVRILSLDGFWDFRRFYNGKMGFI